MRHSVSLYVNEKYKISRTLDNESALDTSHFLVNVQAPISFHALDTFYCICRCICFSHFGSGLFLDQIYPAFTPHSRAHPIFHPTTRISNSLL
jgi:hypothetical protein